MNIIASPSPSPSQLKPLRPDHHNTTAYLLSGVDLVGCGVLTVGLPRSDKWVKHALRYAIWS
jgi:hypothetical protein